MSLAWGKAVSAQFRAEVWGICQGFFWTGPHASWLMSCIAFESGESFSPSVRNAAGSGAVGLIQFMPSTAMELGTTSGELARMSAEDQLAVVERYFRPYARRIHSLSDMYMAILLPKYIGQPESSVLFLDPGKAYRQNSGLDADNNGKITKAEASGMVLLKYQRGMRDPYRFDE